MTQRSNPGQNLARVESTGTYCWNNLRRCTSNVRKPFGSTDASLLYLTWKVIMQIHNDEWPSWGLSKTCKQFLLHWPSETTCFLLASIKHRVQHLNQSAVRSERGARRFPSWLWRESGSWPHGVLLVTFEWPQLCCAKPGSCPTSFSLVFELSLQLS